MYQSLLPVDARHGESTVVSVVTADAMSRNEAEGMPHALLRRVVRVGAAPYLSIWLFLAAGPASPGEGAWSWPVSPPFGIVRPYAAPAHAYGPGHRGIDIAVRGATSVRAPDDGVVAFAGRVVDRGVVTIDHGDGVVSTLEPVEASVAAGARVARGEIVGELGVGGHTESGALHLGARLNGEYLNPLVLLGAMPRAVLLPYADP